MTKLRIALCMLAAWAMFTAAQQSPAADARSELQARFKERLPELDKLRRAGTIGETWDGWVEKVKADLTEAQQKLVDAENADRRELYRMLAEAEKTTPEVVAQRNAQRNYRNGLKGDWFKMKDGQWRQKEQ
jgi:uncharacterized protein YdbL (DUF1318 family)